MEKENDYFKVTAAGDIQLSITADVVTGQAAGFHFGVSWSQWPYTGGVLSRSEAKRLADHIYKSLSECKDTEKECVSKAYANIRNIAKR